MKKYAILNRNTGDVQVMSFNSELHLKKYMVVLGPNYEALEETKNELPTRHVRMKNKDEFAGWGS
jgi:hypothetical protein